MKKICIGAMAHVDAGKTTLSESMLFLSGKIRKLGRVDNQDAYLDTYDLEKARGITIFSKQAMMSWQDLEITLLDTPGHVDFSAEMERTLQVLDYAILVVSGADGVQGHTKTLWRLLAHYGIPVFLFINKMDQNGVDQEALRAHLKEQLDEGCITFGETSSEAFYEELAMCDEALMEEVLEKGSIQHEKIVEAIKQRKVFPCYYGSALKLQGVETFMKGLASYVAPSAYPEAFGAKVFKIARDEQGNRLTYMKITGGSLKVKSLLTNAQPQSREKGEASMQQEAQTIWEEKVNQIRLYSGQKFEAVNEVEAGSICAVTGLTKTYPGEGLGFEKRIQAPVLEPVLTYRIQLPDGCDPRVMLPKLRQLEEEAPELHIVWEEHLQEIQAQLMGEVQIEILQSLIKERFDVDVIFDSGKIVYKETIQNVVEGVGHFEPLRHYAEVHLLLEPLPAGSGILLAVDCSEDELDRNWQRLILTHLQEKAHRGVLIGAMITDVKITLVAGRAHKKHTEGGDFREATYRAVRQGLRQAESVLLEPYYAFQLEVPEKMVGRAMTDIEKMSGTCEITESGGELTVLTGSAPVVTMRHYQKEVIAYTKGHGRLFCSVKGYAPCHNQDEILAQYAYDPERDLENPTGSVFCAHGSGFLVPWDEVPNYMHLPSVLNPVVKSEEAELLEEGHTYEESWIDLDEIEKIFNQTFYANQGTKTAWKRSLKASHELYRETVGRSRTQDRTKEDYLLVDGYNIIYAWPEFKELIQQNMDGARIKLLECLCNYQGIRQCEIIVVFDAYRVQGHQTEIMDYHNIHVVYTKEAETADQYIEKFAHEHHKQYNVTVATSDGLEQIIIRGNGCQLLSARELKATIEKAHQRMMTEYQESQGVERHYLGDLISDEVKQHLGGKHE